MSFRIFQVCVVLLTAVFLSGCDPVQKANETLLAAQGKLQERRALTMSEADILKITRPDVLISVTPEALQRLSPRLIADFNASKEAKKTKIQFSNVEFKLFEHSLTVELTFKKNINDVTVTAKAIASSHIGTTDGDLLWNVYLEGFEVVSIEGLSIWSRFATSVVQTFASDIYDLRMVINAILDEIVNDNPERALLLSLDKKNLLNKKLHERKAKTTDKDEQFKFDEKTLKTGMFTERAAVFIDPKGIMIVSQVKFENPDTFKQPKLKFPKDEELLRIGSATVERLANYRTRITKLAEGFGPDAAAVSNLEIAGLVVTRETISRMVNFTAQQGSVSGTLKIKKPVDEKATLTFNIKGRDCKKEIDGCSYTDRCKGDKCKQTVQKSFMRTCPKTCLVPIFGLLGAVIGHNTVACDYACEKLEDVVEDVTGPACDGFRAADKLYGGALCAIANNSEKAFCDIGANLRKSACDVEQELSKFYKNNPVATVKAHVEPNIALRVSVYDAVLSRDLLTMNGGIRAEGGGPIKASIAYDRHNYADGAVLPPGLSLGLACHADWKEAVEVSATLQPFRKRLSFSARFESKPDRSIEIEYEQTGAETAKVDFKPAPLVDLFLGKPQVAINCPLALVGAVTFGSGEAIFTQENARKIFPLLTGKDLPIEIKELDFAVQIKPAKVCREKTGDCENPLLTLIPVLSSSAVIFKATE